jgi:hypothetical protein
MSFAGDQRPQQAEEYIDAGSPEAERRERDAAGVARQIEREVRWAVARGGDAAATRALLIERYPADLQPLIRRHLDRR